MHFAILNERILHDHFLKNFSCHKEIVFAMFFTSSWRSSCVTYAETKFVNVFFSENFDQSSLTST